MDAKNRYEAVFCNIHDLARELVKPVYFTFSNDAQDMFREWVEEIMTEARIPNLAPVLQSHFIKMQKTVASLALIFELVGHGHDVIGAKATARAIEWANYLKSHAVRLYSIGSQMAENGARLILERRAQLPECFTPRQIYRKGWVGLADTEAAEASNRPGTAVSRPCPPPSPAAGQPPATSGTFASRRRAEPGDAGCRTPVSLARRWLERCCAVNTLSLSRWGFVSFVSSVFAHIRIEKLNRK